VQKKKTGEKGIDGHKNVDYKRQYFGFWDDLPESLSFFSNSNTNDNADTCSEPKGNKT
jgi:hypothetical protein